MISTLISHLIQSTLFAGTAWLLVLALRKHRAHLRYWIWFIASAKFLVPFSLLIGIGTLAPRRPAAPPVPQWLLATEEIGWHLTTLPDTAAKFSTPPGPNPVKFQAGALALWVSGFATVALCWLVRLRRVYAIRRSAIPATLATNLPCAIPILSAPGVLEPGIFGIFRPVLLMPAGIEQKLPPAQLHAILAHEFCHVRRHDNLTSAIHMAAQAIFWFHPLIWWLGARLVDERERACDEEVLHLGSEPRVYAEGILNVCKLCIESPLTCISGVTGSNLKRRIEAIMANRIATGLNLAQKAALTFAATAAVAIPVAVGIMYAPAIRAQSTPPRLKFEVASIKRCTSGNLPVDSGRGAGGGGRALGDPGMFRSGCRPVRSLIQMAYVVYANGLSATVGLLNDQPIQGGPDWMDSDRYTIDARPESPQTRAMMAGPMLQTLLEDRFKLKIHRETKEVPVYALVVAKGGSKLQVTREGGCTRGDPQGPPPPVITGQPLPCGYMAGGDNGIDAVGVTIASLCQIISPLVRRSVIDKSGLTGLFNYHVDFNVPPPGAAPETDDPAAPDPFSSATEALRKLGLKLESAKGDAGLIVIDHLERPTEN